MANQQNSLVRSDGSGTDSRDFSYTFPTFKESEVKVEVDNVVKTLTTHYTIENHNNSTGGTVRFTTAGLPDNTDSSTPIRIFRQTDVDTPKAEFTAGAALKAQEINDNFKQVRHALQEAIGATYDNNGVVTSRQVQRYNIEADAIDGTLIADDVINSEHYAAGSIDLEHMSANSVDSDQYVDGSIDRIHLEADIIDGSKIEDNAVDNEHIATDAVRTDEIQNNAVTMAKLGSGALPTDITIASGNLVNGTIVNADVNASAAIDGTKISPDFGSQNIATTGTVDGRDVSADGTKLDTIETNAKDDQTATEIKTLYESNANTNAFTDTQNTFVNAITATATELNYVDGVTSNVQTQLDGKQPVDAELTELATMNSSTASALADLTQAEVQTLDGITASTAELNLNKDQTATATEVNILDGAIISTNELNILKDVTANKDEINLLDGKTVVTTIASNATDTQLPSAQAVNERITTVVQDVGGFVPIANETSFPVNNPDLNDAAGTIVSIKALSSAFTTGSGVTTKTFADGAGSGKNVTITGLTANTTYSAGRGLILETTQYSGGGRGGDADEYEYAFHRLTLDEAGVSNADALVTNFNERYYGPFSANQPTRPSGANRQNGDLYFNTSDGKMKVFNGSHASGTWDDVAAPGNFFINTISSSSGSGGGSATFNGTATRFTLSNPPLTAQQLLVSINGVVQKPNSGTSPSEGFAIDGADIIFAAAPNSGAPFFIVTIGSSVNIGTPSDGTVTSAKIVDGTIVNGDISSSAGIVSTKLAKPIDFADNEKARFGTGNDLEIYHNGTDGFIKHSTGKLRLNGDTIYLKDKDNGDMFIQCNHDAGVQLRYDNSAKLETASGGVNVTGNLAFTDNNSQIQTGSSGNMLGIQGGATNMGGRIELRGGNSDGDIRMYAQGTTSTQVERLRITSGGIVTIPDNGKFTAGAGNDLEIYHDSNNSIIKNNTGFLLLKSNSGINLSDASDTDNYLKTIKDGAVELYYDGVKKAHTYADGFKVDGVQRNVTAGYNYLLVGSNDASGVSIGLDGDSNGDGAGTDYAYIEHGSDGDLSIVCDNPAGDSQFELYVGSGTTTAMIAEAAGQVKLYHNGVLHFRTETGGAAVIDGNSSVHLRLEGSGGTCGYLTGDSNNVIGISDNVGHYHVKGTKDGATELNYDNTKRFETLSDGTQSRGLTKHLSEDQNTTQTIQPLYLSIPTNTTKTITLTLLLGTGTFTAGGYANAGQGAIALRLFFGGAMFGTQHYNVNVNQNSAMQNTSITLTKNATSYTIAITNSSSTYSLNLNMLLESTGRAMGYAVA